MLGYRSASLINFVVELPWQLETNTRYTYKPGRVAGITECQKRPAIRQSIEAGNIINYHPAARGKTRILAVRLF